MPASVVRKGSTAKDWYNASEPRVYGLRQKGEVLVEFDMGASGGTSNVRVRLGADYFKDLAVSMIGANREAAIKAFGAALQLEPKPPRPVP